MLKINQKIKIYISNVKAEDIVEDKPKKNVVTEKDFAKLTKKAKKQ